MSAITGRSLRLWIGLALWLLLSVGLAADGASAGNLAQTSPSHDTTGQVVLPGQQVQKEAPFDCSKIYELGIYRQMNLRAAQIMQACSGQPVPKGAQNTNPVAPITSKALLPDYGVGDVNTITGGETSPDYTQSESFVWSEGNTIVVNYNDARDVSTTGNLSGVSYSTDSGATFTRILPSPLAAGHGQNIGDPIVVYDHRLALWFAGDLVTGCGGQGVGMWTSPDGITWSTGACAHNGTGDDRESMWVDNNAILPNGSSNPFYGRLYISLAGPSGALQVVYSDNGTSWTTVTLSPSFIRDVQITGGPDGSVFVAACNEQGGGLNPRTHVMYRSTSGGVSWTSSNMAVNQSAPGQTTCAVNTYFAITNPIWRYMGWGQPGVGPGGVVHYAYTTHGAGSDAGDIYYVRSTDNGSTWSAPLKLNTDITANEQWMPSLSVTTWGAVTVNWYDRRNTTNGTNYQVFGKVSRDNGLTWGPDEAISDVIIPQPVAPNFNACYAGDYNYASASSDTSYVTWTDGRNVVGGSNQQDVYFDKISNVQGSLTCDTYTFTAGSASIVAGTVDIGNHCDDCITSVALPFQFRLYDTAFNSVNVSSNGTLQFNSSRSDFSNSCLPYSGFNYSILPHWDDLRTLTTDTCTGGCGVFTSVSGAAPNRIFNIEWRAVYFSNTAQQANFEVRLYEALPSKFDIVIGTLGQSGTSATIGVQQDIGSNYTLVSCNTAVPNGRIFSFALQAHGNYTTSTSTGNFIAPGTVDIGNHADDGVTQVSLPFPFRLYDVSFNSAYASSNGTLQFNSSNVAFTNGCLPDASFNYTIFAHWDDLRTLTTDTCTGGCGIYTSVSGIAPNRIFNIEWRAVYFSNTAQQANFEVRLYEAVNKFDIVYGTVDQGGSSATVGVQRDTGSLFKQFECNTASSLSSGLAVTFTMAPCLCGPGSNYYITPSSGATIDPGTTLVPGSQCDDCAVDIPLPFTYNLYDQTFSKVAASSNGNLQFVGRNATFSNTCLPFASFDYAILPYWDDLRTDSGVTCTGGCGIYTSQVGGVFNIEWRAVYFDNTALQVNFEVRLFQNENRFEVVYGTVGEGGSGATVGVQRDTGSQFTSLECNTANSLVAGRKFTFTESQCNNLLIGHVTWQGRPAQPNALEQVPITLTLKLGTSETDYPNETTDASGFFSEPVTSLAAGTYNWRVKDPKYLANCGTVALTGLAVTNQEMGLMRGGDSNNDNVVTAVDFNILKSSFARSIGQPGYDDRADFTGDQLVNALDFNVQKSNFGTSGCGAVVLGQPGETPTDESPPPNKKE